MVKFLIFLGGMIVGGLIATVMLCCLMINRCRRPSKETNNK